MFNILKKSIYIMLLFTPQAFAAQCWNETCFEPDPLPATGYDFSQQFNEKRYWIEANTRTGAPQICFQRLGLYPAFYQSDKIRCFAAQSVVAPQGAPEGAQCWMAENVIVCQDSGGRVTVHHPTKKIPVHK